MKPQRRLALKRETLPDLGPDDMRQVVGGTHIPTDCGCITHGYSCDACPIPTLPVNTCTCVVTTLLPTIVATTGC